MEFTPKYKHINSISWTIAKKYHPHSEYVKRFEIQYFTCGGSHATLTVDTRANETSGGSNAATMETADIAATPLEKLIRSKLVLFNK